MSGTKYGRYGKNSAQSYLEDNRPLRWFFWDGKLHKTTRVSAMRNELFAWCFPEEREVQFAYSHIKFHHEKAWRTRDVAEMLDRHILTINKDISERKVIPKPAVGYPIGRSPDEMPRWYMWSKKDIYRYHDYLMGVHYGSPRKDGKITVNKRLPNRNELRAKMEDGYTILIQDKDGNTYPAFRETMF